MSKNKGFGKLLAGVAIGAGLGILFAPKNGDQTRKELKTKIDEMVLKLKEVDAKEVKDSIEIKVYQIKEEIESLNKEKVLEIAKEKAKDIQDLAQELVDYTVEKGTPVVEKTANAIRIKTIEITKEILNKLEQEEKKSRKTK